MFLYNLVVLWVYVTKNIGLVVVFWLIRHTEFGDIERGGNGLKKIVYLYYCLIDSRVVKHLIRHILY